MYTLIQKHFALIVDSYNMGQWQLIGSTIKKNNTFDKKQNLLFVLILVSYGFKYVYIIF